MLGPGLEEAWLQGQSVFWCKGLIEVLLKSGTQELCSGVVTHFGHYTRNWLVVDTGEHFSVFKVQCFE